MVNPNPYSCRSEVGVPRFGFQVPVSGFGVLGFRLRDRVLGSYQTVNPLSAMSKEEMDSGKEGSPSW